MGATERRKGIVAEQMLSRYLREHGYPLACSTRSVLGHGGTKQPCDIAGIPGIAIECKNVDKLRIGEALRQADEQAKGIDVPVLVVKPRRIVNPAEWWAVMYLEDAMHWWPQHDAADDLGH